MKLVPPELVDSCFNGSRVKGTYRCTIACTPPVGVLKLQQCTPLRLPVPALTPRKMSRGSREAIKVVELLRATFAIRDGVLLRVHLNFSRGASMPYCTPLRAISEFVHELPRSVRLDGLCCSHSQVPCFPVLLSLCRCRNHARCPRNPNAPNPDAGT